MMCEDTTQILFPKGARVIVLRGGKQYSSRKVKQPMSLYGFSPGALDQITLIRPRNGVTWQVWRTLALFKAELLGKTNSLDAAYAIAALGASL